MASTLVIANATYPDVPAIEVPVSGGGTARFTDVSATTAAAEDVLEGKVFFDAAGVQTEGTGSGGGGSSTKYGASIDLWLGELNSSGQLAQVTGNNTDLVVTDIRSLASYSMYYKFIRCGALKSVQFRDLTTASGSYALSYAFSTCTNLVTASFPALTTVNSTYVFSYAFTGCTKLQSADFSALTSVSSTSAMQYMFNNCTALTSVDFSSLKTIGPASGTAANYRQFYYAFTGCTALTELRFPALEEIRCNGTATSHGTFANNAALKKLYFPKLTVIDKVAAYSNATGAKNIFYSCTGLTEIHFAAANQTAIEASPGYATRWGAPSGCSILFDL